LFAYVLFVSGPEEIKNDAMTYWVVFVCSAVLSLPTYLFYRVVFHWLVNRVRSPFLLKMLCNAFVISCAGLTFYWLGGSAVPIFFMTHSVAVILSSMVLKIRPAVTPVAGTADP
jgi:hypothetical protein